MVSGPECVWVQEIRMFCAGTPVRPAITERTAFAVARSINRISSATIMSRHRGVRSASAVASNGS